MNNVNDVRIGMKVKTTRLDSTAGMFVKQECLDRREIGKKGKIVSFVPGHGGDVWFVEQDNDVAAYNYLEFEPVKGK